MKIKVLGSSSKGNGYLISDSRTTLLLEAGLTIKKIKKAADFKLHEIKGCLITHEHQDHAKAAKDLMKAGVEIYATKGTLKALGIEKIHRATEIEPIRQFEIGTFIVVPFEVQHDAAEPVGFLIASKTTNERLLFVTDTTHLNYRFKNLTHIMIEANYDNEILEYSEIDRKQMARIRQSHMEIKETKRTLKETDLTETIAIILIHLSDRNSHEQRFIKEVQEQTGIPTFAAKKGMEVE